MAETMRQCMAETMVVRWTTQFGSSASRGFCAFKTISEPAPVCDILFVYINGWVYLLNCIYVKTTSVQKISKLFDEIDYKIMLSTV